LPEIKAFFRFCPQCGKRFHIRLVSKSLVDEHEEIFEQKRFTPVGPPLYGSLRGAGMVMNPVVVEENVPVIIDIKDFTYSYRCKSCGHEWAENRTERDKVG